MDPLSVILIATVVFVFVAVAFVNHPPSPSPSSPTETRRNVERIGFHTDPKQTGVNQLYSRGSGDFRAVRGGGEIGQPHYDIQGGFCGPRFDYLSFTI